MQMKQLLLGTCLSVGTWAVPQGWVSPSGPNPWWKPPPTPPGGGPRPPTTFSARPIITMTTALTSVLPTTTLVSTTVPTTSSRAASTSSQAVTTSSRATTGIVVSTPTKMQTTSSASRTTSSSSAAISSSSNGTASYSGNPFAGVKLFVNPYYRDEIYNNAIPQLSGDLVAAAKKVAEVPTFAWLDDRSKIASLMEPNLAAIRKMNRANRGQTPTAAQFVVYNLPDRDCSASSSAGELSINNNGVALYKTEYIDPIAALAKEYSDVRIILIFEPDGLANLITNLGAAKCANAADAIKEVTVYAWQKLNLPNVAIYVDAGHAGWLGWESNLQPTASLYGSLYSLAGKPKSVRGLVTNVSNYNGYKLSSPPSYASGNANYDESRFHAALTPYLAAAGFPTNFIVDLGRAGSQPGGRVEWGHWCNVRQSGFGPRPSEGGNTGIEGLDSVVWVKPGGESDGTSDSSAQRFDSTCVSASAVTPAPEAGAWFQAYFEMLLKNADPSFL